MIIRKNDFVTGERILQSFPYVLLNCDWVQFLRKQTLTLAERTHHYFRNANCNRSIREWQKKIIQYLEEQQRLPFPLFRLAENWQKFFLGKQFVRLQSARGEDFQIPLSLSEDLAYLTGVIMGDGHLADYFLTIIDSSQEHIEQLAKRLQKHFQSTIDIFKEKQATAWTVYVVGKWVVRFFNFLSGQPINERKYPSLQEPLIFRHIPVYRRAFWRGLMDADGGYKKTIGFGTASKHLLTDFSHYLTLHQIHHRFYTQTACGGTTFSFNIAGPSRKRFATLIGSSHPQKQQELQALLTRKVYRFTENTATLRKRGYWQGQVVDYAKEKLLDGYFDFSLVPALSISNLGTYIQSLRKVTNHTQEDLARKISIARSVLSKYERNETTIPITVLLQIFSLYNKSFLSFLSTTPKLFLHSRSSHCLLDNQPSDKLLQLLKGLQFKNKGYIMLHGTEHEPLEQYRQEISDYFLIDIPKVRFHNSVLTTFVIEFLILRN
ncbi:MAG: helix-turn-helix domain-containing protein [Candidatus Heimdallarchaeota archaeon]|nr:helix-turn-helix domain-containing protein [Candidatus Heimdallarchaeota archaeon]